jgi:hypothetical protein
MASAIVLTVTEHGDGGFCLQDKNGNKEWFPCPDDYQRPEIGEKIVCVGKWYHKGKLDQCRVERP